MAFIPLKFNFNCVPFDRLRFIPIQVTDTDDMFALDAATAQSWLHLQHFLAHVASSLNSRYKVTVIKPHYPSAYNFTEPFQSNLSGRRRLGEAQEWFVVWMAIVSYLMAIGDTKERQTKFKEFGNIPGWYEILTNDGYDQIWLNGLHSLWLYHFDTQVPHADTIINILDRDTKQPTVSWFCNYNILVWYQWTQMEVKAAKDDKEIEALAPLPHQIQEVLTLLHRQPTLEEEKLLSPFLTQLQNLATPTEDDSWRSSTNTVSSSLHGGKAVSIPANLNPSIKDPLRFSIPEKLSVFFASQEAKHALLLSTETDAHQLARLQRQTNPPVVSAKVFVWEEDDHGEWIRNAVPKRARLDTLNMFTDSQKRYDSWENEWDCCDEMGGIEDYDEDLHDIFEDDLNPSGDFPASSERYEEDQALDVNLDSKTFIEMSRSPSPPPFTVDDYELDRPHPLEALETLYFFHGFVQPLPIVTKRYPELDVTEKKKMLRALGLTSSDDPIFSTSAGSKALEFVKKLATSNDKIEFDEWDILSGNRIALEGNPRVRHIKHLKNGMFIFRNLCHSASWQLTVEEPSTAAYICRLDARLMTYEIARHLLQKGIQFRTMQNTIAQTSVKPRICRPVPIRICGYTFTRRDYDAYVRERSQLLNSSRGRAALLRGGIVWRLAMETMSIDYALQGPSISASVEGCGLFVAAGDKTLCDDELSQDELDILCGVYYCETSMYSHFFLSYLTITYFFQ